MTLKTVLVTGGAGFIGAQCVVQLVEHGHKVVVIDNCSNAVVNEISQLPVTLERIAEITGVDVPFYNVDLRDTESVVEICLKERPTHVIHCAAHYSVPTSVLNPVLYYDNNVGCTISLLKAMKRADCSKIIFSSSCAVYGNMDNMIEENDKFAVPQNPYGRSKAMCESILRDSATADNLSVVSLRYFNTVGAHESGKLGDCPALPYTTIMLQLAHIFRDQAKNFTIFGDDYDTPDGTAIRDYCHVTDCARAHMAALDLTDDMNSSFTAINIGTGTGTTVKELIAAFKRASGQKISTEIKNRRPGDVAKMVCNVQKAKEQLNWTPEYDIDVICKDYVNWLRKYPNGYN